MPSHSRIALPSGCTSTSLPVKSVSGAEEETCSTRVTWPVTSTGRSRTAVVKQSTYSRVSTSAWWSGTGQEPGAGGAGGGGGARRPPGGAGGGGGGGREKGGPPPPLFPRGFARQDAVAGG